MMTAFHRLKKNKPAMVSLVFIVMMAIVALFAYQIAPDKTSNANTQLLEFQGMPPGYSADFLKIEYETEDESLLKKMFLGENSRNEFIPVNSYSKESDGYRVQHYIDSDTSDILFYRFSPDTKLSVEKKTFLLGTDTFGRDIFSSILIGLRISLAVGFIAVLVSLVLGISLGSAAGYFGGKTDAFVSGFILVMWSIPTILLVFAFTMALGKGFFQIFLAIGLTLWVQVARLVRGQVMLVKGYEYVQAARALGFSDMRIIMRHIIPNIIGPVLVLSASTFASAIMIESGLSFLGIGIQPPQPSLGLMLREHYTFIITNKPLLALIPGFALMLLVLAFNVLGNGLRDAFDVRD